MLYKLDATENMPENKTERHNFYPYLIEGEGEGEVVEERESRIGRNPFPPKFDSIDSRESLQAK